jgi:hypothetical protein
VHKLKPDQAEALRQAWKEGKYPSKMALGKALGLVVRRYTDIYKLVNSLLGLATKFSLTYKNHETLFEF